MQIRQNKREEILSKKRSIGGASNSPFLICVLPLHQMMDATTTLNVIMSCDPEAIVTKSQTGVTHVR